MIEPRVVLSLSGLCVLLSIYLLVVFRDITSDPLRVGKDTWSAQSWQFPIFSNSHRDTGDIIIIPILQMSKLRLGLSKLAQIYVLVVLGFEL